MSNCGAQRRHAPPARPFTCSHLAPHRSLHTTPKGARTERKKTPRPPKAAFITTYLEVGGRRTRTQFKQAENLSPVVGCKLTIRQAHGKEIEVLGPGWHTTRAGARKRTQMSFLPHDRERPGRTRGIGTTAGTSARPHVRAHAHAVRGGDAPGVRGSPTKPPVGDDGPPLPPPPSAAPHSASPPADGDNR
jgi:hypothetical protein